MFHGRVSLKSVLLLLLVKFCECVQVGIDLCILHHKYQVKPHLSPWFSAACAAAIVHRIHFFVGQSLVFPDCWKVSSVVLVFKNVEERSTAKNYCPAILPSMVSKVFEKLVNNRIADHLERDVAFFLIPSMVLGLLDQLLIF